MWRNPSRKGRTWTKLEDLVARRGGAYRTSGQDGIFHLYTSVCFAPVKAERRNFTVGLLTDPPPIDAARNRSAKKRREYWEHTKRLQKGSLVTLVLVSPNTSRIFLGTSMSSSGADIADSAATADRIEMRVSFFNAEVAARAAERSDHGGWRYVRHLDRQQRHVRVRQAIKPTSIPFAHYIARGGNLDTMAVEAPLYTRVPGFGFNLQCLAKPGETIQKLDAKELRSVVLARARVPPIELP